MAIGETSLQTLLSSLTLSVSPTTFVWISLPTPHSPLPTSTSASTSSSPPDPNPMPTLDQIPIPASEIQMVFHEPAPRNTTTLITSLATAEQYNLPYQYRSRMITCAVHSSLDAVGFLAVLTTSLAAAGVSCNPVSAYFHDHLFVEDGKVDLAVEVLRRVVSEARAVEGQREDEREGQGVAAE